MDETSGAASAGAMRRAPPAPDRASRKGSQLIPSRQTICIFLDHHLHPSLLQQNPPSPPTAQQRTTETLANFCTSNGNHRRGPPAHRHPTPSTPTVKPEATTPRRRWGRGTKKPTGSHHLRRDSHPWGTKPHWIERSERNLHRELADFAQKNAAEVGIELLQPYSRETPPPPPRQRHQETLSYYAHT